MVQTQVFEFTIVTLSKKPSSEVNLLCVSNQWVSVIIVHFVSFLFFSIFTRFQQGRDWICGNALSMQHFSIGWRRSEPSIPSEQGGKMPGDCTCVCFLFSLAQCRKLWCDKPFLFSSCFFFCAARRNRLLLILLAITAHEYECMTLLRSLLHRL